MQTTPTEPLVTFNHRYEAIHRVAFSLLPNEQYNNTIIVELPQNTRDKLLRKISKKNSYIRTLDDAFKQAIEISRETSFVEAASGCYNEQNNTRIDTQINKLDDSFEECDINAMNTGATNRSTDGSHNGFLDRSGSRNSSLNSSYNSRPSYRNNSYSNNSDSYNRQGYNRDNNRNKGYQPNNRYDQKNQNYHKRYDNNQDRWVGQEGLCVQRTGQQSRKAQKLLIFITQIKILKSPCSCNSFLTIFRKKREEKNVVSFLSFLDPSYDYFISYRHNIDHDY